MNIHAQDSIDTKVGYLTGRVETCIEEVRASRQELKDHMKEEEAVVADNQQRIATIEGTLSNWKSFVAGAVLVSSVVASVISLAVKVLL